MEVSKLNVMLLGHKDHGKSTLIGHILCDTKSITNDRIRDVKAICASLGKEFEYAFLLDSFQEEREGEMTWDVVHAEVKGGKILYDLIDVPGHKELIRNMLTGASHADAGVLIISAKEGIEEQTKQHVLLARTLGMDKLIVAVNKMDIVNYDEAQFNLIKRNVSGILSEMGFDMKNVPLIPVSAKQGDNLVTPSKEMPWYRGPTLFKLIEEKAKPLPAHPDDPLRLPVQDNYGGVIVGRIESGRLIKGQKVSFEPSGQTGLVDSIIVANEKRQSAEIEENPGFETDKRLDIKRGDVCCGFDRKPPVSDKVSSKIIFLKLPKSSEISIECGTAEVDVEISIERKAGIGEISFANLKLSRPIVIEKFVNKRGNFGKFVVMEKGEIIGVGIVNSVNYHSTS